MRVTITKRDIQRGVRCSSTKCPISQALYRMGIVGTVWPTIVRRNELGGLSQHTRVAFAALSKKAQKFIKDFDNKKKVSPLTIILKFGNYA